MRRDPSRALLTLSLLFAVFSAAAFSPAEAGTTFFGRTPAPPPPKEEEEEEAEAEPETGLRFFGRRVTGGNLASGGFARGEVQGDFFPGKGAIDGLEPVGRLLTYRDGKFDDLYGSAGERYIQFGMTKLMSANYSYKGGSLSLEIVTMEEPLQASGLFHYHRGTVLRSPGRDLSVGAEGVLDTARSGRNLYFYRSNMFVKIVYSGLDPVPDLLPVAEFVDSRLPSRRDDKPAGIDYIDVEGVDANTVAITPGFTFNSMILPASVWASAPGGGSQASDLYIVTRLREEDAEEVFESYVAYLKMYASYIEEYTVDDWDYVKSVDPGQGRVVLTCYRNAVIIAARPDGYERGEVLIKRVMDKMDEVLGPPEGGRRPTRRALRARSRREAEESRRAAREAERETGDGEAGERRGSRWNPFRRGAD